MGMILSKPLMSALCLNAFFLVFYLCAGSLWYSSLDDYFMAATMTGAYGGELDPHLYFVNSIYGYFLKPFYLLFPKIGWYSIFQLLSVFASFIVVIYLLLRKSSAKLGLILSFFVLCCIAPDFYFQLSFTQCAAVCTAAGTLLLYVGQQDKNKFFLMLSSLFFTAGFVFRREEFFLVFPFLLVLLVIWIISTKKIPKAALFSFAVAMAIVAGLYTFDKHQYVSEEYNYYAAYQPIRALYGDGAYFDDEAIYDEMEERELHGLDFNLSRSWVHYDTEVFSLDSLMAMKKIVEKNLYEPNILKMPVAILNEFSKVLYNPIAWCWVILCAIILVSANKKYRLYPWLSLSVIIVCVTYLLLVNRVVYHVEVGIWLYAIVGTIPFIPESMPVLQKYAKKLFIGLALLSIGFFVIGFMGEPDSQKTEAFRSSIPNDLGTIKLQRYMENRPGDAFLLPLQQYQMIASLDKRSYVAHLPRSWQNIFPLGYWNVHLPGMKRELEKRGVDNPLKDIVNENVYVVQEEHHVNFLGYYSIHYHESLSIDTVFQTDNVYVLKYRRPAGEE